MNIELNQNQDEAQEILAAMRQIQDSPELQVEAAQNPESLLDRLKLSGAARHAVALAITAAIVAPGIRIPLPDGVW